ncbi:hypothetical protein ACQEVY_01240 [Streptomyces sp. CA-288835]|uniref:hypothetical protein n=1 Tax=Streptomyces sp. CA-288835 TaxID=3240069 RepID=UPI003D93BB98
MIVLPDGSHIRGIGESFPLGSRPRLDTPMTDEHERMMRANQANWDARTAPKD